MIAASEQSEVDSDIFSTRWSGEQLRALPREPVRREAHPFAHGNVGAPQPFAYGRERTPGIRGAAGTPVDRIGLDRKSRLAKDADGARQMIARRDEQPALARL